MANQVMATLEARVAPERWAELAERYTQLGSQRPPQLAESFLLQSAADPVVWRLVSIWQSQQQLDEYRTSVPTPGGVLLFRSVGAEPTLSVFEIKAR